MIPEDGAEISYAASDKALLPLRSRLLMLVFEISSVVVPEFPTLIELTTDEPSPNSTVVIGSVDVIVKLVLSVSVIARTTSSPDGDSLAIVSESTVTLSVSPVTFTVYSPAPESTVMEYDSAANASNRERGITAEAAKNTAAIIVTIGNQYALPDLRFFARTTVPLRDAETDLPPLGTNLLYDLFIINPSSQV